MSDQKGHAMSDTPTPPDDLGGAEFAGEHPDEEEVPAVEDGDG